MTNPETDLEKVRIEYRRNKTIQTFDALIAAEREVAASEMRKERDEARLDRTIAVRGLIDSTKTSVELADKLKAVTEERDSLKDAAAKAEQDILLAAIKHIESQAFSPKEWRIGRTPEMLTVWFKNRLAARAKAKG